MRLRVTALPLCLALLGAACTGSDQAPISPSSPVSSDGAAAKPSGDLAVTTTVEALDGNGLPGDLSSDGGGAYLNGVGGVTSVLMGNTCNGLTHGDWLFVTNNSTRAVGHTFDPADAIQPGDPRFLATANPPYWGTQAVEGKLQLKCTCGSNVSIRTMAAGSSITCPLLNSFVAPNGTEYGNHAALSWTGFPETSDVQIVCNAADGGGCRDWIIEPIAQGQAATRLTHWIGTNGKNREQVIDGGFYLRFRIHVTRP